MLAPARRPVPDEPEEKNKIPQGNLDDFLNSWKDEEEPDEEAPAEEDEEESPDPLIALAKSLGIPKELIRLREWADMPNVAADPSIDDQTLRQIASQVADHYDIDKNSRTEWEEAAKAGIELASQKKAPKNYPFQGAANITFPLLTTAAMQFNARAYPSLVNGQTIVRSKINGPDPTGMKAARGYRVSTFMSHQILDGMPDWETEMDTLLMQIPIVGCAFKKAYWNPATDAPDSKLVSALDFVVNQSVKTLRNAPRMTHSFPLYQYEIEERQRTGIFLDVPLSPMDGGEDSEAPIRFLEQHCYFDLDDDGVKEPWIVTIEEESHTLVRIVAGYNPDEIEWDSGSTKEEISEGEQAEDSDAEEARITRIPRELYFVKYGFLKDFDGGFYDIGFGKLLQSLSETIDSSLNQMLDAGHLQNAGGGFIGSGLNFETEEFYFQPGMYYTVDAAGQSIRDAIVQKDFPGPSPVLFQLLGMLIDSAKQMTSIQDILTGATQNMLAQPTTVMALIDQGMKVFTAIYKRVYEAMRQEFGILYDLNRKYLDPQEYAEFFAPAMPPIPSGGPAGAPLALPGPGMPPSPGPGAPTQPPQGAVPPAGGAGSPIAAPAAGGPNAPTPLVPMGPVQPPPNAKQDFGQDDHVNTLVPVADPNQVTEMQRMAKGQYVASLYQGAFAQLMDGMEVLKYQLEAGGIDNPERFLAKPNPNAGAMQQLQEEGAKAQIAKTESEAEHNRALALRESSMADYHNARAADVIAQHMPQFFQNPGQGKQ